MPNHLFALVSPVMNVSIEKTELTELAQLPTTLFLGAKSA
jgi:hypothetical protein